MAAKTKILLTNDDGADAPGLWALFRAVESIGEPVVVAPWRERSACSHSVTVGQRMALAEIEYEGRKVGYRLDGMPSDCVKLALSQLYRDQVALVLSGVNWGSNLGTNVIYSGTVAGAIEAAMYGRPAMAISLRDGKAGSPHFDAAARIARRLALDVLAHGLPGGVILNVNVPNLPLPEIAGAVLTRQGHEVYVDEFRTYSGENGKTWCVNEGTQRIASSPAEHPLDDLEVNDRRVSITPLHFDLTNTAVFEDLRDRIDRFVLRADDDEPMPARSGP